MAYKGVFGVEKIAFPFPGHIIIIAARRHPVIPNRYDLMLLVHNASANLCVAVLAALRR